MTLQRFDRSKMHRIDVMLMTIALLPFIRYTPAFDNL